MTQSNGEYEPVEVPELTDAQSYAEFNGDPVEPGLPLADVIDRSIEQGGIPGPTIEGVHPTTRSWLKFLGGADPDGEEEYK